MFRNGEGVDFLFDPLFVFSFSNKAHFVEIDTRSIVCRGERNCLVSLYGVGKRSEEVGFLPVSRYLERTRRFGDIACFISEDETVVESTLFFLFGKSKAPLSLTVYGSSAEEGLFGSAILSVERDGSVFGAFVSALYFWFLV